MLQDAVVTSDRPAYQGRLADLANRLAAIPGVDVDVEHGGEQGVRSTVVSVTPPRGACPLSWIDLGEQVVLQAGAGGRWELTDALEELDFLEQVVAAVVAGRVSDVTGPAHAFVTVRLGDGTIEQSSVATAPVGCVPLPGWRRWGRRTDYHPYL